MVEPPLEVVAPLDMVWVCVCWRQWYQYWGKWCQRPIYAYFLCCKEKGGRDLGVCRVRRCDVWCRGSHGSVWDPVCEEFLDLVDGRELFMVHGCWRVSDCTGDKFESMDDSIVFSDCELSKVVIEKINFFGG